MGRHQMGHLNYSTGSDGDPQYLPSGAYVNRCDRPAAKITGLNSSGTLLCIMGLSLSRVRVGVEDKPLRF